MSTVETFEHIIRHQSAEELVPFLLELPKPDTVAVRKKAKSLEKELTASREEEPNSWGNDITRDQTFMFLLSGIKTYARKEGMSPSFQVWTPWLTIQEKAVVLEAARTGPAGMAHGQAGVASGQQGMGNT
jgi:hypothetical protein